MVSLFAIKWFKIVATGYEILRLKCSKFDFGTDPLGSYKRSPELLAELRPFKGPTSKGRGGRAGEEDRGEEVREKEWREGRRGEEEQLAPHSSPLVSKC